ncbi:uncharacterized protein [Diadema antillarum]|uniref:uncharacterized protein n=1 Tax=Diadema antillarum TaxID=105358 RepID=UPI003A869369
MANQPTSNPAPTGKAILWTTPRMIAMAFTKCLSGVPGCQIWIEPFGFSSFAREEMKKAGITELPWCYEGHEKEFKVASENLENFLNCYFPPERLPFANVKRALEESDSKYVFVKDESVSMKAEDAKKYLPTSYKHSFLLRHPLLVFNSFRKALFGQLSASNSLKDESHKSEDVFDLRLYARDYYVEDLFENHYNMWKYVKENIDPSPMVIDAADLLDHPHQVVSKYCECVGFPYSESLLKWNPSPEVASAWKWPSDTLYRNKTFGGRSMESSEFIKALPAPAKEQLTEDVVELAEQAMPFYDEMYGHRLQISA